MMELVFDYMRDAPLRHSLNALTQQVFGFNFEAWVTGGYFEGDYIPYSFVENGQMVANVSANRMHFLQNGVPKYYVQLGTVMTAASHRRQGLAAKLLTHVIQTYQDRCDGIYLFGNLSALGFYRKAGFAQGTQYRYTCKADLTALPRAPHPFIKAAADDVSLRQRYMDAVRNSAPHAALEQTNRFGLQMFYTADLAQVYYAADLDCFAVMETNGDTLELQSVICRQRIPLKEVLARIDTPCCHLRLGFAPCGADAPLFTAAPYDGGADYRLFCDQKMLQGLGREKLFFPVLSHA